MNPFTDNEQPATPRLNKAQFGGALISAVATAGVVMVLIQGTLFLRAKDSSKFLNSEKSKVMATQLAEAGIEENIADLGSRKLVATPGMEDMVTYQDKALGGGTYTTKLTTVGTGAAGDTVSLVSDGSLAGKTRSISAKLGLKNYLDSSLTPIMVSTPETTFTYNTKVTYDTTVTTTTQNPNAMPAFNSTSAYSACIGSSAKKCDVCHLPGGDVTKANVINVSKSAIDTHVDHHGDYVTTDGTCDIYKPKDTKTITSHIQIDTVMNIATNVTYDTVVTVDTLTKVEVLSWR